MGNIHESRITRSARIPEAGQALRESERWLKEGVEVSMERREENYKKIQAGITGRITKEQLEEIQAPWACLG